MPPVKLDQRDLALRRQQQGRTSQRRRGLMYDEAGRPLGPPTPGLVTRVKRMLGV
jgi:hypothetical protein